MLEKMFTTKMSMDKKKLQNRFLKIRSKNGKISKFIALAVFAVIIVLIICVSIFVAVNRQDDTEVNDDVKLTFNGQLLEFTAEPYSLSENMNRRYTGQMMVYFPLEELSYKLGAECKINENKAIIKIPGAIDNYEIEVSKNEIFYSPVKSGNSGIRETKFAPEIKKRKIYIPYEFIEYIWIDANGYDIFGSVLYKNEKMNIQFEIPMNWLDKYIVDETMVNDDYIQIKHKRIAEKYDGGGALFSISKNKDSEIEELMNVLENQTVMWRNQEYGYILGRPANVQHPIWENRDKEDIILAEEYEKMYKDISYVESTFCLIKEVDGYNILNAENLSYAQIKDLQRQADNGHFPWRLDYEQVIMMYLSGMGEAVENGELTYFAGDGESCTGTYMIGDKRYTLDLFKPIDKSENGIWIVRSVKEISSAVMKEIFFYDCTPFEKMIEKMGNWYKVPQNIRASFSWFEVGRKPYPISVSAYFAPTGTEMEEYKKEVGKIEEPYLYRSMAQVLSMDIQFPNDATTGHLWFVFNYEDGTSETSEIYNILADFAVGDGRTETFTYNGLELDVSNVVEKKKQTATDGFETWEYDIYVISEGAKVLVKDANMFYDENKKAHSSWAFGSSSGKTEERINIVNGMSAFEIPSDIKGIYNTESSVYVLMFETIK